MGVRAPGSAHARPSAKPAPKKTKRGTGGVSQICFTPILFFCDLKPHAKFQNHTVTPSGRKVTRSEKREKNAINSGHLVP